MWMTKTTPSQFCEGGHVLLLVGYVRLWLDSESPAQDAARASGERRSLERRVRSALPFCHG